jgi:hypothetical protein
MKKAMAAVLAVILVVGLCAVPVLAKGPTGPAGKSNTGLLYLHEKTQDTWEIVEGGAWGKMKYNLSGPEFCYVFNGHGLQAGVDYQLIYYPDPWPGSGVKCLGMGTANGGGNVHISGSVNTGDLPIATDDNHIDNLGTEEYNGAKIWLILADDYDCETASWNAWNGASYLFEADLITFDDTDE